jgi:hypothetical protein
LLLKNGLLLKEQKNNVTITIFFQELGQCENIDLIPETFKRNKKQ